MSDILSILRKIEPLEKAKWKIEFLLWKVKIAKQSKYTKSFYNVYKTYWIAPERIRDSVVPSHLRNRPSNQSKSLDDLGLTIGGDWDLETIPFETLDVFRAFKEHFVTGKRWSNTEFYQRVAKDIQDGRSRWRCKTINEFDKRLDALEVMYHDIRTNGYRAQSEFNPQGPYGKEDEIIVHIGRHGDYIFAEGRHRLSLAKLAGIHKVPVKVARRHVRWLRFRQKILSYAAQVHKGYVYHPLPHPDLADIHFMNGTPRMKHFLPHIPHGGGRLLDIGAHWGYFSHCFEKLGFDCTAVEMVPRNLYFLHKLRRAENREFKVFESLFDTRIGTDVDVVLGLNIFHHFLREKTQYEKLIAFLERLETRFMFFQPHSENEPEMESAYKNYSERDFIDFIQCKVRLPKATLLGRDYDGRCIYKLEH